MKSKYEASSKIDIKVEPYWNVKTSKSNKVKSSNELK